VPDDQINNKQFLEQLGARIATLDRRLRERDEELHRIYGSLSWRLTHPVRASKFLLVKVKAMLSGKLLSASKRALKNLFIALLKSERPTLKPKAIAKLNSGKHCSVNAQDAESGTLEAQSIARVRKAAKDELENRTIFVDISQLASKDSRAGTARVVRSMSMALPSLNLGKFQFKAVYAGPGKEYQHVQYFRQMLIEPEVQAPVSLDEAISPAFGDIFLGLDWCPYMICNNLDQLLAMRFNGVKIYFVVYDLLPLLRPEFFPSALNNTFLHWFETITTLADGLICISQSVADEVDHWLTRFPPERDKPLHLGYIHLGADISGSLPSYGLDRESYRVLKLVTERPSFLLVGTVEPRKGHIQALGAFEELWEKGFNLNLIIVGQRGWMLSDRLSQLHTHIEFGDRLTWLEQGSDELLELLYADSTALLMPSEGEGFGLPLIEAAKAQLPIIARDLPIFREIAQEHAFYFKGLQPCDLADAIEAWLHMHSCGKIPASKNISWLTWKESSQQLLDTILDNKWYKAASIQHVQFDSSVNLQATIPDSQLALSA